MKDPPSHVVAVDDLGIDRDGQDLVILVSLGNIVAVVLSLFAVGSALEVPAGIALTLSVVNGHLAVLCLPAGVVVEVLRNNSVSSFEFQSLFTSFCIDLLGEDL